MKSILFVLCLLPLLVLGQETTIVKEVEKSVSVDVNKSDNGERDIKIVSSTNGDKKVFQWKDDGNIPADIKSQLEAEGIDIHILDRTENIAGEDVDIHIDRKEMTSPKKVVIKMIEDEGDTKVMEWDGDGDMPSEMQELLDEHDISIESLGNDEQVKKTQIKMIKKESKKKSKRAKEQGRKMNKAQKQKYRTVTIDDNGNQEVKEWESEGNQIKIHKNGDHKMIWIGENGENGENEDIFVMNGNRNRSSDAYMGAAISSSETEGAIIEEITENGPAANSNLKKGDVIQKVNGARIKSMEDLLDLLSYYEPTDQIELTFSREGKEEKVTLKLGKRPKASRL